MRLTVKGLEMKSLIRVGLVGCGGIMSRHIKDLLSNRFASIAAMADPVAANIARYKAQFPALASAEVYSDYRDLLKAGVDAVVIASPHTFHAKQILDSFARGCHVLCEKPMVTSIADARRVLAAEKKTKLALVLAYQRHFQGGFLYMRRAVQSGELGRLNFIQAMQCQEWTFAVGGTWRTDPKFSGFGQLSDSGSHLLDIITWVTGLKPARIAALVDCAGYDVDVNSAITVEFESGAIGNITIVGNASNWWEDITLNGTKGTLFYRNGVIHHKNGVDGEMRVVNPYDTPWFKSGLSPAGHFIDVIRGKAENQSPSISGLLVVEICQTAVKSAKSGGKMMRVRHVKV